MTIHGNKIQRALIFKNYSILYVRYCIVRCLYIIKDNLPIDINVLNIENYFKLTNP